MSDLTPREAALLAENKELKVENYYYYFQAGHYERCLEEIKQVSLSSNGEEYLKLPKLAEQALFIGQVGDTDKTGRAVLGVLKAVERYTPMCKYRSEIDALKHGSKPHHQACMCMDCEMWKAWETLPEDFRARLEMNNE